jgi:hypothetical protein
MKRAIGDTSDLPDNVMRREYFNQLVQALYVDIPKITQERDELFREKVNLHSELIRVKEELEKLRNCEQ